MAGLALVLASCENGDKDFPDYIYQTISFAQQTPIRWLTLGEDGEYDVSLDNQHIVQVCPVLGGVNTNKSTRWAQLEVDPSLIAGMYFEDGTPVKLLPTNYYTFLGDTKVEIKKGSVLGYLDVKLEDAFFADPEAVNTCYVLPMRITAASDSILMGEAKDLNAPRPSEVLTDQWSVAPKNYTLYAIKYKNVWAGVWLSKSRTTGTNNGVAFSSESQAANWESADLKYLTSKSLTESYYAMSHNVACVAADGSEVEREIGCDLILNINDSNVSVSTNTPGCTASGSGTYTYHGAPKAWNNTDRDLIEVNYTYEIPYVVDEATGQTATYKATVTETLVARDRQSKLETFSYTIQ